ncbi:MAG: hypothetical protein IPG74_11375 [Flavobacteriales bacterium]|nr:hypothetical protein [Flavobacteriales bacterium]
MDVHLNHIAIIVAALSDLSWARSGTHRCSSYKPWRDANAFDWTKASRRP